MKDQELEVKFYVLDLVTVEDRLKGLGARLRQPRTYEINLRFDTPDGELTRAFRVLRLRQDTAARLTYKGPMQSVEGVRLRPEIEFTVGDFHAARALLEALGYQVSMIYEKYRAVYNLGGVSVTLDELPYGNFVEIEGPDAASIHAVNHRLDLNWEARVPDSYTMLFTRLKDNMGLTFRHLTFESFKDLEVTASALSVQPADL